MMAPTVGLIGLGKLGLPTAVTLALRGIRVNGFDIDPKRMTLDALSPYELSADRRMRLSECVDDDLPLRFCSLPELVRDSDCVLVAVETPHAPDYEGVTPLPETRKDFSYEALVAAARSVAEVARATEIGIISTALPGSVRREIVPVLRSHTVIYCPQFVAMGSVAYDLCNPEFTLLGYDGRKPRAIREVFESLSEAPIFEVSYETAELAKVVYNTFISAKVTLANLVQETAARTGASATDVFAILHAADRRLASPAYLGPGMGDGGPCHPRDNIALSWLARELAMDHDMFSAIMLQRQNYTEWLGERFTAAAGGRPLVLLGTAYKPGTDIETGSSAVLLANLLRARGETVTVVPRPARWDPAVLGGEPGAFFIGCPEPEFVALDFPPGSVVVDPWLRVPRRDDVTIVRIGEHDE